jgi:hypothetical protein
VGRPKKTKMGVNLGLPHLFQRNKVKGCVGLVESSHEEVPKYLYPNSQLQISKNVNIMVLKVMTLTIIIHCIQNSILANLLTTRMIKVEDMGEAMVLHK